mmetsp:Transcript_91699/g.256247  ORF Transcript_91699/g.256247 Transcript_91699/m.256247 type:complete len:218 (+) Transcript_91699:943-1596(+)
MGDDDVLGIGPLHQLLPPGECKIGARGEADEVAGAGLAVDDADAHLVDEVEGLEPRVGPREPHLLGDLVRGRVHGQELALEVVAKPEPAGQGVLHSFGPVLVGAHSHRDGLVLGQGVVLALLVLRLDQEQMVDVEDLRVEPHLDDADRAHQGAVLHIEGGQGALVDLVVQLGEGLGGEVRCVDAVVLQQHHQLLLLAVAHKRPRPLLRGPARPQSEV